MHLRSLGEWPDRHCPYCEEGWEIGGSFDERFGIDAITRVVASFWVPCEEHEEQIDDDGWDVEFAGHSWRWTDGGWTPV